jgi:DNA-binding CsgD family transcriptional regulator
MTTALADTEVRNDAVSTDLKPVAALAVTADDLSNLRWELDEDNSTRVVALHIDNQHFVLESEDEASEKQTTVYGSAAEKALDALLDELGLAEEDVIDRVDRRSEVAQQDIQEAVAETSRKVEEIETRLAEAQEQTLRLEERRREAAATLVRARNDLTERQYQTLSLLVSGMTEDEVAQVLEITRASVLRHMRNALAHGRPLNAPSSLTTRERQIASLVAEGRSNSEIAKKLVVTLKTVDWHLRQAYRKLGIDSRDELIAIWAESPAS